MGDNTDSDREWKSARTGDRGDEEVFHENQECGGTLL
jgi:hypothetical protein